MIEEPLARKDFLDIESLSVHVKAVHNIAQIRVCSLYYNKRHC